MGISGSTNKELFEEIAKKTGYTNEQIEKKKKEFMKFSTDGKSLNLFDLQKWAQATSKEIKLLIPFGHKGDYQALFRTFDVDSNGYVDFFEFCWITYFLDNGSGTKEDKFRHQSGYLTKDEVFMSFSKLGMFDLKRVEALFELCDKDKDGKISMDEWIQEMDSNSEAQLLVDPEARKKVEDEYLKSTIPENAIAFKTLIGRRIIITGISLTDSVLSVKEKIAKQANIAVKDQRLLLADGKELQDNKTLVSYNIELRSTHNIIVK